ncbi:MAG: hypothetical protein ACYDEU_07950 [Vulcanimicrobiaceae bacterium]
MMKLSTPFSIACLAAALLMPFPARAQLSFPSLPGAGNLAVQAAAKQLAPYVEQNQPVILDWKAIYPTVPVLPGAAFHPTKSLRVQSALEAAVARQLHNSTTGTVLLPPGDYAIPVRLFCTDIHRHANSPFIYLLGPLRGSRAGLLTRLYANAATVLPPTFDMQSLSWDMQAGMSYPQLGVAQQALYNRLLPGESGLIAQNFLSMVRDRWNTISGTIPGVPSFDGAIGQMGAVGATIETLQSAQNEIIADAGNFDALRSALVLGPLGTPDSNIMDTPWSVPSARVYLRVLTEGAFMSIGLLEIRVVAPDRARVPITSNISYPPACLQCQPLTMHPLRGDQPQPALPQSVGVFAR